MSLPPPPPPPPPPPSVFAPSRSFVSGQLTIRGARENNLLSVDVTLPKKKFIVFTGVSGSGKSSLVFDTIAREAQRQLYGTFSTFIRAKLQKIPRPQVDELHGLSPVIVIDQKRPGGQIRSTVGTMTEIYTYVRLLFARCGLLIPSTPPPADLEDADDDDPPEMLESSLFSFNTPEGMCPCCSGVGIEISIDPDDILDWDKSLSEGAILHPDFRLDRTVGSWFYNRIRLSGFFDMDVPVRDFSPELVQKLLYEPKMNMPKKERNRRSQTSVEYIPGTYEGIIANLKRRYVGGSSTSTSNSGAQRKGMEYFKKVTCRECNGTRLCEKARRVRYREMSITDVVEMEVGELLEIFEDVLRQLESEEGDVDEDDPIEDGIERGSRAYRAMERKVLLAVMKRLRVMVALGIGYLSLSRLSSTLSGGEAQRVKIAKQLNCDLVDLIIVLDEPTIGLHPVQIEQLTAMLLALRDKGNTVLVIEHDQYVVSHADWVVELGPGAGSSGGKVVFSGPLESYRQMSPPSIGVSSLLSYERGLMEIEEEGEGRMVDEEIEEDDGLRLRRKQRKKKRVSQPQEETDDDDVDLVSDDDDDDDEGSALLEDNVDDFLIQNATTHNLQDVTVRFPRGVLTCVTGVAGSGKSTLIMNEFVKLLEGRSKSVIRVDQFKIHASSRSNPATYTKSFDVIRRLFARSSGEKPGFFSFNSKVGACESCKGSGILKIEMHFLENATTPCPVCRGKRFKDVVLQIRYRGKTIHDVLEMTVSDALGFFNDNRKYRQLKKRLEMLEQVGLGYVRLGQPLSRLSGGEKQRIVLASQLHKTGEVYIMDEPSLGLSSHDLTCLIQLMRRLVDGGNSVVVIEHNMEIVSHADWVIDLGPGGGRHGGRVLYSGHPDGLLQVEMSKTARFLKAAMLSLKRSRAEEDDGEQVREEIENDIEEVDSPGEVSTRARRKRRRLG